MKVSKSRVRQAKYTVCFVEQAATYDAEMKFFFEVKRAALTWDELIAVVLKKDRKASKDGWGIIPSRIERHQHKKTGLYGFWRQSAGCMETNLLVLDVENYPIGDEAEDVTSWVRDKFPGVRALIYTSWNHGSRDLDTNSNPKWTPGEPRARIIMPLLVPVDSQRDWRLLYEWVIGHCDGAVDKACKDPCRLSFLFRARNPAASIEPWHRTLEGNDLDPESLPRGASLSGLRADRDEMDAQRRAESTRRTLAIREGVLSRANTTRVEKYGRKALERSCYEISVSDAGERHDTIYRKAFSLGTMVASDMIDEYEVLSELLRAAEAVLPQNRHEEVRRTVVDGLRDGANKPFDVSRLSSVDRAALLQRVDWDSVDLSKPIGIDSVVKGGSHG